jgi:hypothetical protein
MTSLSPRTHGKVPNLLEVLRGGQATPVDARTTRNGAALALMG